MKKSRIILCVITGAIVIKTISELVLVLFIGGAFFVPLSFDKAERILEKNREQFQIVADYFGTLEDDSVYIPVQWLYIYYVEEEDLPKDTEVAKAIKVLSAKGTNSFTKRGTSVDFHLWSNMNSSRGILYSTDGSIPTTTYLIDIKKINGNWYFYESSYDEWHKKHSGKKG